MLNRDATEPLALTALRYAAGDLAAHAAAAFEARLAGDPAAQDALAEAVRLSARAAGHIEPAPHPFTRAAVARRLRPYRGHPMAWAALGVTLGVCGGAAFVDAPAGRPAAPAARPAAENLSAKTPAPAAADAPPPGDPMAT